jgi:hypothetical protein
MCCVGAHRTSLAPGPRPRRLAELRPCSPERLPSSPSPPNSAIAPCPPSIFSAVASVQGKKAATPSFSSSSCTCLHSHGEPYVSGSETRSDLDYLFPGNGARKGRLLTVYIRMKVHMDLHADSTIIVKGPFFPQVVNPRYRICGTMCNTRIQSRKARKAIFSRTKLHLF